MSSKPLVANSAEVTPESAKDSILAAMDSMIAIVGKENWKQGFASTPRWNPKHSKKWRPLGIDQSPSAAKRIAQAVGAGTGRLGV